MSSGQKRFEAPRPEHGEGLPILVAHHDECSTNLCCMQYMVGALQLRVVSWRDPVHRIWNDFRDVVKDVEAWGDVLECLHILGLSHGPWQSCAWWQTTREAVNQYFSTRNISDPLWVARSGSLAADFSSKMHEEPGSEAEQRWLWRCVQGRHAFSRTDNRPTLTRWFEVVSRWLEYDKEYSAHFLSVLLALRETGVYKNIMQMPIWGEKVEMPEVDKETAKNRRPPGMRKTMQMASAEERLRESRTKTKNALHLGAILLGQPDGRRRKTIVMLIGDILYKCFAKELSAFDDPAMLRKFLIAHSAFGGGYYLREVCSILTNSEVLVAMGFPPSAEGVDQEYYKTAHGTGGASSSSSSSPPKLLCEVKFREGDKEDAEMAELLWSLCFATVKQRSLSMGQHAETLPGQFLLLVAGRKDPETVKRGLNLMKEAWETLTEAEVMQHKYPSVMQVLKSVGWAWNTVVREILVLLAQHDFHVAPPAVEMMVNTIAQGYGGSVINERCFKAYADCKRENSNEQVSRVRRYFHPVKAKVLEQHGRADLDFSIPASEATQVPRRLPSSLYEACSMECSLPQEQAENIMKPHEWSHPSTSAAGLRLQVGAWHLLLNLRKASAWADAASAWQALLLPENKVVTKVGPDAFSIVLKNSVFGVLLWPAEKLQFGRLTLFQPVVADAARYSWRMVLSWEEWQVVPTQALPPHLAEILAGRSSSGLSFGVRALQNGLEQSAVVASAWTGFASLTETYLDRLMAHDRLLDGLQTKDKPKGGAGEVGVLGATLHPEGDEGPDGRDLAAADGVREGQGLAYLPQPELAALGGHHGRVRRQGCEAVPRRPPRAQGGHAEAGDPLLGRQGLHLEGKGCAVAGRLGFGAEAGGCASSGRSGQACLVVVGVAIEGNGAPSKGGDNTAGDQRSHDMLDSVLPRAEEEP